MYQFWLLCRRTVLKTQITMPTVYTPAMTATGMISRCLDTNATNVANQKYMAPNVTTEVMAPQKSPGLTRPSSV